MRGKTWKLAAVTLGLSISAAAAVYAQTPGWSLTGEGWRYMSVEGQYQAARWFQDTDGRWYHFDQSGIMQTGWQRLVVFPGNRHRSDEDRLAPGS